MNENNKIRPILTIAIPTFNREMYLCKCLENVYSQIGNDSRYD
ncbi:MAG: hypothetical protein ACREVX_16675 [Clostridium sp.]